MQTTKQGQAEQHRCLAQSAHASQIEGDRFLRLPPQPHRQIAAGGGVPNPWYALLFLAGAIIMRGAGCTLNDIADRNFDGRVERTRLRPIPAGQVSVTQALALLVAHRQQGLGDAAISGGTLN